MQLETDHDPEAGMARGPRVADADVDELLSAVAHELTTPIASARAFAQLLPDFVEFEPDSDAARALASIRRNLQLAALLVDQLGDVRAVEQEQLDVSIESVDLVAVAEDAVADLRPVVLKDHPTRLEYPDEPVTVATDPARIRQVLFNLLSNAARYSDAGTPIVVTVTERDAHAVVIVRNHGLGIAPADAERIFEKYVRAGDASGRSRGAGLGLYLSRQIARALGGELTTRPAPEGPGSQFVLRLPERHDPS